MAYVSNPFNTQEDDKEENQQGQPGQAAGPIDVGGPQGGGTISAAGQQSQAAPNKPSSSGRFMNLQKYIKANQGFKQDQGGLAGQISQNIQKGSEQVKQNTEAAKNAFQQQAGQAFGQVNQLGVIQQAVADPTQFMQNQQNVQQLAKVRDAQYTGPKSLQDVQGAPTLAALQIGSQNVSQQSKAATSEAGRFGLLKQMFGRPSYTRGQQSLDNLILQGDQGQLKRLQGTRSSALEAQRAVQSGEELAKTRSGELSAQAAEIQKQARQQLNQAITGQDAAIQARLEQAKKDQEERIAQVKRDLGEGYLAEEDYNRFKGLQDLGVLDLDLSGFVRKTDDPTAQRIATADEYARIKALSELTGGAISEDASVAAQMYSNAALAGDYGKNPYYTLDEDQIRQAASARQAQYEASRSPYEAARSWMATVPTLSTGVGSLPGQFIDAATAENAVRTSLARKAADERMASTEGQQRFQQLLSQYGGPAQPNAEREARKALAREYEQEFKQSIGTKSLSELTPELQQMAAAITLKPRDYSIDPDIEMSSAARAAMNAVDTSGLDLFNQGKQYATPGTMTEEERKSITDMLGSYQDPNSTYGGNISEEAFREAAMSALLRQRYLEAQEAAVANIGKQYRADRKLRKK